MTQSQMNDATRAPADGGARRAHMSDLKQPLGLFTLSSVEMWERFSFYGLQVILAYYIYYSAADGGLGLSEGEALAIAGAYGGAVYLGQPVGAWFADRLVPARTMVMAGGIIIMSGHISLAVIPDLPGLVIGLALIPVIVGMIAMGVTEVMYAPIGMSVASQLSPQAFTSQTMALWGLTTAAGASLSGFMGQLYTVSARSPSSSCSPSSVCSPPYSSSHSGHP